MGAESTALVRAMMVRRRGIRRLDDMVVVVVCLVDWIVVAVEIAGVEFERNEETQRLWIRSGGAEKLHDIESTCCFGLDVIWSKSYALRSRPSLAQPSLSYICSS